MFKKQMEALAASRLTLGMSVRSRDVTINTQPISRGAHPGELEPSSSCRCMRLSSAGSVAITNSRTRPWRLVSGTALGGAVVQEAADGVLIKR